MAEWLTQSTIGQTAVYSQINKMQGLPAHRAGDDGTLGEDAGTQDGDPVSVLPSGGAERLLSGADAGGATGGAVRRGGHNRPDP